MSLTFMLLLPLYVTAFWVILLNGQKDTHSKPRSFLAKLMFLFTVFNIARFSQLEPLPQLYVCFDVAYLFGGTLGYPLYHIYFRLLTVEEKFSWKAHYRFLALPIVLGTIYLVAVLLTPHAEYKAWLFDRNAYLDIPQIRFLKTIRLIILLSVEFQGIFYLVLNTLLLRRYNDRAEQFYSNMGDGKYNNAKILNWLVIINCLIHVFGAIDFIHISSTKGMISSINIPAVKVMLFSILYAVDYYMMGYMGYKQKAINPTFEVELDNPPELVFGTELSTDQKKIHKKLLSEFDKNKIYLNSELTILDVVQVIGTNRTYVSTLINQEYNQNFCAFVNSYRIDELERIIHEDDHAVNEVLAERAGFGSVKSMKRAISSKTGLSMSEWRKQIAAHENKLNNTFNQ